MSTAMIKDCRYFNNMHSHLHYYFQKKEFYIIHNFKMYSAISSGCIKRQMSELCAEFHCWSIHI